MKLKGYVKLGNGESIEDGFEKKYKLLSNSLDKSPEDISENIDWRLGSETKAP